MTRKIRLKKAKTRKKPKFRIFGKIFKFFDMAALGLVFMVFNIQRRFSKKRKINRYFSKYI
jgi:hypothetical protein